MAKRQKQKMMDLNQIDIEQLIAFEGYEYRLSSGNRGLQINCKTCPACNRTDYKVYFNAESGLGNCFGCDEKFNKFKFVKFARGLADNASIMRYLDGIYQSVSYKPRPNIVVSDKINKDWVMPLNRKIEADEDLPQYLKDRGIDAKLAKRFDLRVCDNGFYKYTDYSDKQKAVDFSERIIIPIYDIDGNPATFQGRDMKGTSNRKYLFPNMLPGTARYIYNSNYIVKNKIKKVVLNEGVFDVFATTKALESEVGYKEWAAAGTFGKHFSIQAQGITIKDQLSDLAIMREAGVEEFVIMWDGERNARLAALKAGLRLKAFGFPVTVALGLPDGCDPAESTIKQVLEALDNRVTPTEMQLIRHRIS
jgi:DNA primase